LDGIEFLIGNMIKEEFMECLAIWPLEIQEQLLDQINLDPNLIDSLLHPKPFIELSVYPITDWSSLQWKKKNIKFNTEWMNYHMYNGLIMTINRMIGLYARNINHKAFGTNDLDRHNRIKEYVVDNGTWPKPPIFVLTEDKKMIMVDGAHRMCQILVAQNTGIHIQEKHEVWIGSNK